MAGAAGLAEAAAVMRAGRPELVGGFSHCPEHGEGLLFRGQLFIYLREDCVDRRVPLRKHKGSFPCWTVILEGLPSFRKDLLPGARENVGRWVHAKRHESNETRTWHAQPTQHTDMVR